MWEKTIQHINDLFKPKPEASNEKAIDRMQMIKLAIVELEQAINNSTEALSEAMGFQKNLSNQANQHKIESDQWNTKAAEAYKIGEKAIGSKALEHKEIAESKYQEYLLMTKKSEQSVAELKMQLDKMKIQLAESKTKDALLSAEITGSATENEFKSHIGNIPTKDKVNTSETEKTEPNLPKEEIEVPKNALSSNETIQKESKEEALDKKMKEFFSNENNSPKENNNVENKNSALLDDFFGEENNTKTKESEQKRIDDFFNEE